jgi:hypothetical protein
MKVLFQQAPKSLLKNPLLEKLFWVVVPLLAEK